MIIFLSNNHNELVFMEEIDVYISKNKNCNQLRYYATGKTKVTTGNGSMYGVVRVASSVAHWSSRSSPHSLGPLL